MHTHHASLRTIAIVAAVLWAAIAPGRAAAADREHQQIMADLRMLQEQANMLQALMRDLGDALKAVNARLDDQTAVERKGFADGKVQMDTLSGDLRIVREKVDETNVRLGTISQELEYLRQLVPPPGAPGMLPSTSADPSAAGVPPQAGAPGDPAVPTAAAAPPPLTTNPAIQPQRLWQSSYADYAAGQYTLAVQGFQSYLQYFPRSQQAHEAQLMIGEALLADGKHREAVAAYDRVIGDFPGSASVPQAYYKRGFALETLKDVDRARESYDALVKQFPDSQPAVLARQRLVALKAPAR